MYPSQWQRRCWRYLCYELGGPPLISISSNFFQRIPTGRPTWDSRHGGHGGSSPYFTFLISPKRTARTGGPPLISILIPIQTRSNLHGRRPGTGGPPLISVRSRFTRTVPAAGIRCRKRAKIPTGALSSLRCRRGHEGCHAAFGPQPRMHLCRNRASARGRVGDSVQALGRAGPQGGLENPCKPPPPGGARPVPSWLPHGGRRGVGHAILRPSRRGWTGSPPRLRVGPGEPPPGFTPTPR